MNRAWLGRLLRNIRAGEDKLLGRTERLAALPPQMSLTSPAFRDGETIPVRHAGRGVGANVSPSLSWSGVPPGTVELALVIEDPDVPLPRPIIHLCAYGFDPDRRSFAEGALRPDAEPNILFGRNTWASPGYAGPRALPGHGPHRYVFQLFALAEPSGLRSGATPAEMRRRIAAVAFAYGRLIGLFEQVR